MIEGEGPEPERAFSETLDLASLRASIGAFSDAPDRERASLDPEDLNLGVLRAAYSYESGISSLEVSAQLACERHGCNTPVGTSLWSELAAHHALLVGNVQKLNGMNDPLYPKGSFQLHQLARGESEDEKSVAVSYAISTKDKADPRYVIPLSTSKKWMGPQYMAIRPLYEDAAALVTREPVGLLTTMHRTDDGLVEKRNYFLINNEVLKRELAVLDWTSRYVAEMREKEIRLGTSLLPTRCLLGDAVVRCALQEVHRESNFIATGTELTQARIPSSIRSISLERDAVPPILPGYDDDRYRCKVSLYVLDLGKRRSASLSGLMEGIRDVAEVDVNLIYHHQSQLLRVQGALVA